MTDLSKVGYNELARELQRRDCTNKGHPPAITIYGVGVPSRALCDCGEVTYQQVPREAKPGD